MLLGVLHFPKSILRQIISYAKFGGQTECIMGNWKIVNVGLQTSMYLLSNSENREHLKNFRNVDWVLANHTKVQDMQANLKTTNSLLLLFAV